MLRLASPIEVRQFRVGASCSEPPVLSLGSLRGHGNLLGHSNR